MELEKDPVIRQLAAWGKKREEIRALILTSSMVVPGAPVDALSDYDVIVVVRDIHPFLEDDSWLEEFGPVLVVYRDPVHAYGKYRGDTFARITQYTRFKIDFSIWPVSVLQQAAADEDLDEDLDLGYAVVLDKDDLTAGMKPPSHKAYIPSPPCEAVYLHEIEMFFHEGTYCIKSLWRNDLLATKYFLDHSLKQNHLRRMLEWQMECEHGWTERTSVLGRYLQSRVRPEVWAELEETYVGARMGENWAAFDRVVRLYCKTAQDVGERLGFGYPRAFVERMMDYFAWVKGLER